MLFFSFFLSGKQDSAEGGTTEQEELLTTITTKTVATTKTTTTMTALVWNPRVVSLLVAALVVSMPTSVVGFSNSEVKQWVTGLWRLTGTIESTWQEPTYPLKEFSVFPKKQDAPKVEEHLLLLQEDGSFKRVNKEVKMLGSDSATFMQWKKGTWDFVDGKLILASDRPPHADVKRIKDTVLEGDVQVSSQEALLEAPVSVDEDASSSVVDSNDVGGNDTTETTDKVETASSSSSSSTKGMTNTLDIRLSVPKGTVKLGRFTYPKTHPDFFENPMFRPKSTGTFELRQVMGHTVEKSVQTYIDRFRREDLAGKKYWLSSYPLPSHTPKKWSDKKQKYVDRKYSSDVVSS